MRQRCIDLPRSRKDLHCCVILPLFGGYCLVNCHDIPPTCFDSENIQVYTKRFHLFHTQHDQWSSQQCVDKAVHSRKSPSPLQDKHGDNTDHIEHPNSLKTVVFTASLTNCLCSFIQDVHVGQHELFHCCCYSHVGQ